MMKHKSPVLRSSLVVAAVALLPLTEAAAQVIPPSPVPAPSRSCLALQAGTGTVDIVAGPKNITGSDMTPDTLFPVFVTSGTDPNCPPVSATVSRVCMKWQYKWKYNGVSPSHAVVLAGSDVYIIAKGITNNNSPTENGAGAGDSTTGVGFGVFERRVVRFNASGDTFAAAVYTTSDAKIGKVSAGFMSGNRRNYCAIAGADNPQPGDPLLSKPTTKTTNTLGCTVDWTLSADGCVIDAVLNPLIQNVPGGICQITYPTVGTTEGAMISATCGAEWSVPGSSTTCTWSSALRRNVCVTVP